MNGSAIFGLNIRINDGSAFGTFIQTVATLSTHATVVCNSDHGNMANGKFWFIAFRGNKEAHQLLKCLSLTQWSYFSYRE